ncbi:MAG: type IV pilus assembly protein PilM [Microgenomates group bacterium LiPW_31]|nr:MAG: type IV pilus assembly protein PilM [Microgenomates group bacterium LiPW_31]
MDFFGLDIGSYSIKAVQLRKIQDKYQLVAVGSAPSTPKGLASEAESDLTALAENIKKLHQETKVTTKNVISALPEDQVFTRVITLPKLSEEELTSALKWEAEQYVPIPLSEVTLAHQVIGETTQDTRQKTEVLLVAAPNRLIDKLLKVLKTAGLNPISLETEILAMSRSLVAPDSEATLLVDLGARATDIAIIEKGQVVFTRSISTAGEALTRAVAGALGLEAGQAEEYKKAYGVDPGKLEGKVSQAIEPILEVIVKEMEQAIQFYQQEKEKTVKRIVLTGGTAILPEVVPLLAKKLTFETQIGDPFSRVVQDSLLAKIPKNDLLFYTVAVGLAMKEI